MNIAELGGGSWLFGIIIVIFAALTLFNISMGCLLTIEKIFEKFGSKGNRLMYVYIIVTSLGIVALKIILERS